jgi:phosphoribosylglycinamide formyltransferase-1
MKTIVILTGDEMRHEYFRKKISNDRRFNVAATFCEGTEKSLEARTFNNDSSTDLEKQHVVARRQSEIDFFGESVTHLVDYSNPIKISKGAINNPDITKKIIDLNPDLLICYGSSLVKTELINIFQGRFINVHLGLSPYYRGSGTNVWPLINLEPEMVGATFMYIDAGIDTGKIIHQISADIFLGDGPHSIGNRLIMKMVKSYADIVANFDVLKSAEQPIANGRLYKMSDFDGNACKTLYQNFKSGMIESYLQRNHLSKQNYLVKNKGLVQ